MATKKEFTVTYTYIKTDDGTKMLKAPQFGGNYTEQEREELIEYVLDTELFSICKRESQETYTLENAWSNYKHITKLNKERNKK